MQQGLREEAVRVLEDLPEANVRALLQVLRRARERRHMQRWNRAIGSLSDADACQMRSAIEEGCERIDDEGW